MTRKNNWTPEENEQLLAALVGQNLEWINWKKVSRMIPSRTKIQCVVHYHQSIKGKPSKSIPVLAKEKRFEQNRFMPDTNLYPINLPEFSFQDLEFSE